jgi:DNA repair protein RadC
MAGEGERLRIKQLSAEDRPREKMLLKGAGAMSDAELLALLLGSGNNEETAVQLAQRLLKSLDNRLDSLGRLSLKEMMAFKGVGPAKAVTIAAALEIGRRRHVMPDDMPEVKTSTQIFAMFYPVMRDAVHEEMWMALTNGKGKLMEKKQISMGGVSHVQVDIRLILKEAINTVCNGMVICHNHPSGDPEPSDKDNELTLKLAKAAETLNMKLLDHVIIGGRKYYSYHDKGLL